MFDVYPLFQRCTLHSLGPGSVFFGTQPAAYQLLRITTYIKRRLIAQGSIPKQIRVQKGNRNEAISKMPFRDIEFKTFDNLTLRGWLFTPSSFTGELPCLVMAHGFAAHKEMGLNNFAEYFTSNLRIACLAYDNRCLGTSDGEPRREIIPGLQINDYSDAITFVQSLPEIDPDKIAVWGSSYSGGHVLTVGAVDRRVKAVISQV